MRRLRIDASTVALGGVVAFWAVFVVAALPQEIVQDSWLALVSGREVARHGLPHTDPLTAWTLGRQWIDEQWLGQLFYYGLSVLGGIRAVMLAHAAVLVATVAVGLGAARRLGASTPSTVLGALAALVVAPWGMQMRTQDLGELFFVVVLALLARDACSPSRRVYLALPLLVLWANVHGSVVLGCALVALRAVTTALPPERKPRRAALLLAGAGLAPFASPYGFALFGYYRHLLLNPLLHWFIDEWGPSTPSARTAAFYALAFGTVWVIARDGSRHTPFARLALLLTLFAGVDAMRNIVWFGLCALVLLPRLLDPYVGAVRFETLARMKSPLAAAAALSLAATAAFAATRSDAWLLGRWPTGELQQVAALAERDDPHRVFADDRYADWLLWNVPRLRGRVAYDVRFELFDARQIRLLSYYRNRIGDDWRAAVRGYPLVVFDPALQEPIEAGLRGAGGYRLASRAPGIVVLERTSR